MKKIGIFIIIGFVAIASLSILTTFNMGTQFEDFRDDDNGDDDYDDDGFEFNYNLNVVNQDIQFIQNLYKISNFFRI